MVHRTLAHGGRRREWHGRFRRLVCWIGRSRLWRLRLKRQTSSRRKRSFWQRPTSIVSTNTESAFRLRRWPVQGLFRRRAICRMLGYPIFEQYERAERTAEEDREDSQAQRRT